MKKCQNCEFLSLFLTKEGSNKYIKLLCKMKLWDKLEKDEFVGKCFVKKVFLKTLQNSQEKLCWSLFFNKVAGLRPESLLKKRLQYRCFPLNLVKFFKNSFFKNTSAGCFCTKALFLLIFSKEKRFKLIFFQLTGLTGII